MEIDELWARAVTARVAGIDALVLTPEDLVLHLCIHLTNHLYAFCARACGDLAETIREYRASLSWDLVAERAVRWRCRRGVYLALRLAHDAVGADVPDTALRSLTPNGFDEGILAVAMRQQPASQDRVSAAVAKLTTHSLFRNLRTLGRRVCLPPAELARRYNLTQSSPLLFAWYAVRLRDVVMDSVNTGVGLHRERALSEYLSEQ